MKTDNDAVADFALYVREQTKAGEVIPHTKVETLLDAKRRTANYRRRLKTARKVLLRQDIELDGYGAAKSIGLRRLAAQELVEKTGQRIRATNRAAKRALTTCGVASAHVKGNGDIRLIAARAAIARTMGRQAKTALAARHARRLRDAVSPHPRRVRRGPGRGLRRRAHDEGRSAVARGDRGRPRRRQGARRALGPPRLRRRRRPARRQHRGRRPEALSRRGGPGVAVYFTLRGRRMVMAQDLYWNVHDNMRSIGLAIEHLRGLVRGLERHGGGNMMGRAFDGFAALPPPKGVKKWWTILGADQGAHEDVVRHAYRTLAKKRHPDAGDDATALAKIQTAYEEAMRACT